MLARSTAIYWLVLALSSSMMSLVHGAQPLPAPESSSLGGASLSEPLAPMVSPNALVNEAGFFARWRADHQERAARDGWIETDRPSFTLASSTVPRGWLQLEGGYT